MQPWSNLKEIASTGQVMIDGKFYPANILIRNGYSSLIMQNVEQARNMVTQQVQYICTNDGDFIRNVLYDVYDNDEPHCLNVFGARMLIEHKEFAPQGERQNEVRFNYTGIQ